MLQAHLTMFFSLISDIHRYKANSAQLTVEAEQIFTTFVFVFTLTACLGCAWLFVTVSLTSFLIVASRMWTMMRAQGALTDSCAEGGTSCQTRLKSICTSRILKLQSCSTRPLWHLMCCFLIHIHRFWGLCVWLTPYQAEKLDSKAKITSWSGPLSSSHCYVLCIFE